MKKIIGILIVVVIVIIWVISSGKTGEKDLVKIGVLFMQTGDGAAWGENAKKGADLAFEEYQNSNPKNPIEVVYEDTETDAKGSVTAFNKVVSLDKVDYILGPLWLHETTAINPLIQKEKIPVISPSYFSMENRTNLRNPLLMWLDAVEETDRVADYVIASGIKSVSIISTTDAWESTVGKRFEEKMKEANIKVITREVVQTNATDVRLNVTKMIKDKPDVVFVASYWQYVHTLKALGEQQYKGKVFSIEIDEYLAGETKSFGPEVYAVGPEAYSDGFSAKFEKKYGTKPGMPAGHAYDAARLLLENISKHGKDREAVLENMKTITSFDGTSGLVEFTPDGRTVFPTALFHIKDGKITRVQALE